MSIQKRVYRAFGEYQVHLRKRLSALLVARMINRNYLHAVIITDKCVSTPAALFHPFGVSDLAQHHLIMVAYPQQRESMIDRFWPDHW